MGAVDVGSLVVVSSGYGGGLTRVGGVSEIKDTLHGVQARVTWEPEWIMEGETEAWVPYEKCKPAGRVVTETVTEQRLWRARS